MVLYLCFNSCKANESFTGKESNNEINPSLWLLSRFSVKITAFDHELKIIFKS